jgi:hypothetical protein
MPSRHPHAPLGCIADVLRFIAARSFAISMSLIYFHSTRCISVSNEYVWKSDDRVEHDVSSSSQAIASEQAFTSSYPCRFLAIYNDKFKCVSV